MGIGTAGSVLRSVRIVGVICIASITVWTCMTVSAADATVVHRFASSFGSTVLKRPIGVSVDSTSGAVYVADSGNDRVVWFSSVGELLGAFDGSGTYEVEGKVEHGEAAAGGVLSIPELIAVDSSSSASDPSRGDVYVFDREHGVIDKFTGSGDYLGEIKGTGSCSAFEAGETKQCSVVGMAVSPTGNLWVSVDGGAIFDLSDSVENGYLTECTTPFNGVGRLALDSEGGLYFYTGKGVFAKDNVACENLLKVFGEDENAFAIAVDPIHGLVYMDSFTNIESFDVSGHAFEGTGTGAVSGPFGEGDLAASRGVAVNASSQWVYASDAERNDVVAFDALSLPTVTLGPVSDQTTRGVTLNGLVNPEGVAVSSCRFEYDTRPYARGENAHGASVPCSPASLGSGSSPVPVEARLTGLTPQASYFYRLVAENSTEIPSESGGVFFTGPLVEGQWASGVTSNSATLHSDIDSNGADTTYLVEYGNSPALGLVAPVVGAVDLGSAVGQQSVSVHLSGLTAGVEYFYRFVAVQDGESFSCTGVSVSSGTCDRPFRTLDSSVVGGLLDGRVWELVSPPDKRGALIEPQTEQGGDIQAADDGGGISYIERGPSVDESAAGHVTYSQMLSRRGADGVWGSRDLTLPGRLPAGGEPSAGANAFAFEYRRFSSSLGFAAIEPQLADTPPLSSEVSERTLYRRDNGSGSFLALVGPANTSSVISPPTEEHGEWGIHFLAATPDIQHVVLKTPVALTEEAVQEEEPGLSCRQAGEEKVVEPHCFEVDNVQWNLYEWSEGSLQLVNVLPNTSTAAHGRASHDIPGVRLAGMQDAGGDGDGGAPRAVSDDGRRAAWTWGEPYTATDLASYRGLFVRDMSEGVTVKIGGLKAIYQSMSSDGTKIFYLENGELYMYEWPLGEPTGVSTDLTSDHLLGEPSADVQETVSNISDDGSYVYFVAKGSLAVGATSGDNNLYVAHESGGVWGVSFIAALADADRPSWFARRDSKAPFLGNVSSRVSPNGRFLAFMSQLPLTGYDNTDEFSGQRDEEVFLYDAVAARLVCASCDPSGARPLGVLDDGANELLVDREGTWINISSVEEDRRTDHWLAGSVPGWVGLNNMLVTYQPRFLSNSGRLFFDSSDGLVPGDTNGLEDVYEFEPEGVGGCSGSSAGSSGLEVFVHEVAGSVVDGCVGLVSSGTSGAESAFLDASENGDDVFFVTGSKLSKEDYDKGYDVYDAHVCTNSVPCRTVTESLPPCESGDECKLPPTPQPEIFGAPSSSTFEGVGNVEAPRVSKQPAKSLLVRKLARALQVCHKKRGRARRHACEVRAKRAYRAHRAAVRKGIAGKGKGGAK